VNSEAGPWLRGDGPVSVSAAAREVATSAVMGHPELRVSPAGFMLACAMFPRSVIKPCGCGDSACVRRSRFGTMAQTNFAYGGSPCFLRWLCGGKLTCFSCLGRCWPEGCTFHNSRCNKPCRSAWCSHQCHQEWQNSVVPAMLGAYQFMCCLDSAQDVVVRNWVISTMPWMEAMTFPDGLEPDWKLKEPNKHVGGLRSPWGRLGLQLCNTPRELTRWYARSGSSSRAEAAGACLAVMGLGPAAMAVYASAQRWQCHQLKPCLELSLNLAHRFRIFAWHDDLSVRYIRKIGQLSGRRDDEANWEEQRMIRTTPIAVKVDLDSGCSSAYMRAHREKAAIVTENHVAQWVHDRAFTDDDTEWMETRASHAPKGAAVCADDIKHYCNDRRVDKRPEPTKKLEWSMFPRNAVSILMRFMLPLTLLTMITKPEFDYKQRALLAVDSATALVESFASARAEQNECHLPGVQAVFRQAPEEVFGFLAQTGDPGNSVLGETIENQPWRPPAGLMMGLSADYAAYNEGETLFELIGICLGYAAAFRRRGFFRRRLAWTWCANALLMTFLYRSGDKGAWCCIGLRVLNGLCSGSRLTALLNTINHVVFFLLTVDSSVCRSIQRGLGSFCGDDEAVMFMVASGLMLYCGGLRGQGHAMNAIKLLAGLSTEFLQRLADYLGPEWDWVNPVAPALATTLFGQWYQATRELIPDPVTAMNTVCANLLGRGFRKALLQRIARFVLDCRYAVFDKRTSRRILLDWWDFRMSGPGALLWPRTGSHTRRGCDLVAAGFCPAPQVVADPGEISTVRPLPGLGDLVRHWQRRLQSMGIPETDWEFFRQSMNAQLYNSIMRKWSESDWNHKLQDLARPRAAPWTPLPNAGEPPGVRVHPRSIIVLQRVLNERTANTVHEQLTRLGAPLQLLKALVTLGYAPSEIARHLGGRLIEEPRPAQRWSSSFCAMDSALSAWVMRKPYVASLTAMRARAAPERILSAMGWALPGPVFFLFGGAGAGKSYLCSKIDLLELDTLRGECVEASLARTRDPLRSVENLVAFALERLIQRNVPALSGRSGLAQLRRAADARGMNVLAVGYEPGFELRRERLWARVVAGTLRESHYHQCIGEEPSVVTELQQADHVVNSMEGVLELYRAWAQRVVVEPVRTPVTGMEFL